MRFISRESQPTVTISFQEDELKHIEKALWDYHNGHFMEQQKDEEWPNEKVAMSFKLATQITDVVTCKND
jgi:hypothetical protein